MVIVEDVFAIADKYDAFFVDMYGVLYDGVSLFSGVIPALKKLKDAGKKIIILSNSSQTADVAEAGYNKRGMEKNVCYDVCVTSGEFMKHELSNNFAEFAKLLDFKANSVAPLFQYNEEMFAQSPMKLTTNFDDADIIYIGAPRNATGSIRIDDLRDAVTDMPIKIEDILSVDWRQAKSPSNDLILAEIAELLDKFMKDGKPLLIANPDIFAPGQSGDSSQKVSVITQGCLGKYYEKRGGKVIYIGKPYREIFNFAKSRVAEVDNSRIAMIGDTPWTDILGANQAGINSIMILTGIAEDFFALMPSDLSDEDKVNLLLNDVALKMMDYSFLTSSTRKGNGCDGKASCDCENVLNKQRISQLTSMLRPHYIVRRFASAV